ncbi:MAG: trimethylamine methyltransferase family protein [Tissierellales bacterium]|nr:trimethylamine methyltransferase family protein [Tissierellales bacterium]MBN2826688.1 trimethylamine methyltransferase family protein [Tissierellales bacterium]
MKIRNYFLSDEEIKTLHQATIRVLTESGVEFNHEDALALFKKNNVRVEGKQVYINEEILQKTLKTVPKEFVLSGRRKEDDVLIGAGNTVYAPASGPVFTQRDNERRPTTGEDYINLLKLFQTSPVIPIVNANMTEPQDMAFEDRDIFRLKNCLALTTKPLMGFTTGTRDAKRCVETIKGFYNNEDKHYVLGVISPVSPLCFDESMIEGMMAYATENQPVLIASCSLPGATSPVTIAGSLVTNNAEVLAGIVYTQLLRPGLPVIYGGTTTSCDMRMVTPAIGSPETGLFTYGVRGLSAYYGLPCRSGGSLTDSKSPDMQAGIESTYTLLSAAIAGIDYVLQACGILESFSSICFEKIVMDEENIKLAKRYVSGFEINEKTLAIDVIKEVGTQGTYITQNHTYQHFKDDFIQATLMSKDGYEQWEKAGSKSFFQTASQVVEKRLSNYIQPELSDSQKDYLEKL